MVWLCLLRFFNIDLLCVFVMVLVFGVYFFIYFDYVIGDVKCVECEGCLVDIKIFCDG